MNNKKYNLFKFINGLRFAVVTITTISAMAMAAAEAQTTEKQSADKTKFESLRYKMMETSIKSIPADKPAELKSEDAELKKLIDEVKSLKIPDYGLLGKIEEEKPVEKKQTDEVKTKEQVELSLKQQQQLKDEKYAAMLKALEMTPENIVNPMAIADLLYKEEKLADAEKFYQLALTRTSKESLSRSWILFQIANCVRKIDPTKAAEYYQQTVNDYPNSYWTQSASSQLQIIEWFNQNEVQELMTKYVNDPNSL